MKIRTKSCDAKRKGVAKNNIERNRLALAEALNMNKEVIFIILILQLKNSIEKLMNTKNELIQQIKQKDIAILELSKYYDVSNIYINVLESDGKKR